MKIALDLDGVLYPWQTAVHDWCVRSGLTDVDYHTFWKTWWWTRNTMFFYNVVRDPTLYENHVPTQRLMDFLKDLSTRHTIFYITARPPEMERVTERYLSTYKFPNVENLILSRSKGIEIVRNRINVMVEDNFKNAEEASIHCTAYLVNMPYNVDLTSNSRVTRINSVFNLEGVL